MTELVSCSMLSNDSRVLCVVSKHYTLSICEHELQHAAATLLYSAAVRAWYASLARSGTGCCQLMCINVSHSWHLDVHSAASMSVPHFAFTLAVFKLTTLKHFLEHYAITSK
jgi:hypothetical protein